MPATRSWQLPASNRLKLLLQNFLLGTKSLALFLDDDPLGVVDLFGLGLQLLLEQNLLPEFFNVADRSLPQVVTERFLIDPLKVVIL